ncbi:hypothetical protein E2C01_074536 [Portunus trituberculatus]|uniref:Uncharacterized protein n=1 Tax=Portunus trituberculatus TaxID=210409 RepID=A0A5B7IDE8_PORTR|nr:hypothetical protein [Portunus trituberculatus]
MAGPTQGRQQYIVNIHNCTQRHCALHPPHRHDASFVSFTCELPRLFAPSPQHLPLQTHPSRPSHDTLGGGNTTS